MSTTGYLEQLFNEDQDLVTFALSCARAMAILSGWRSQTPWPEHLAPWPSYAEHVEKARGEAHDLLVRWRDEGDALGQESREETLAYYRSELERDRERGRKIEAMRAAVAAWTPPTPEHAGLKGFMLDQLAVYDSMADWYEAQIRRWERKPLAEIVNERIAEVKQRVVWAEEEHQKHLEQCKAAQEFLSELRASLAKAGVRR